MTVQKGGEVKIQVSLKGFNSSSTKKHGFHVNESGDLGKQCTDAGGHFNPTNFSHGGPNDRERYNYLPSIPTDTQDCVHSATESRGSMLK